MTDVLQADIFFFIASVATVIFLLLISLVLWQLYKIIRLIRTVLERVESASEVVAEDVAHIRQLITSGGIITGIMKLFLGQKKRRAKRETE